MVLQDILCWAVSFFGQSGIKIKMANWILGLKPSYVQTFLLLHSITSQLAQLICRAELCGMEK